MQQNKRSDSDKYSNRYNSKALFSISIQFICCSLQRIPDTKYLQHKLKHCHMLYNRRQLKWLTFRLSHNPLSHRSKIRMSWSASPPPKIHWSHSGLKSWMILLSESSYIILVPFSPNHFSSQIMMSRYAGPSKYYTGVAFEFFGFLLVLCHWFY